jgi:hypothetical protein
MPNPVTASAKHYTFSKLSINASNAPFLCGRDERVSSPLYHFVFRVFVYVMEVHTHAGKALATISTR